MNDQNGRILVYGAKWCPDAKRARAFMDSHGIVYDWFDVDEVQGGREIVKEINKGKFVVPTIIFPDGTKLVEPSDQELAEKFGKQ